MEMKPKISPSSIENKKAKEARSLLIPISVWHSQVMAKVAGVPSLSEWLECTLKVNSGDGLPLTYNTPKNKTLLKNYAIWRWKVTIRIDVIDSAVGRFWNSYQAPN